MKELQNKKYTFEEYEVLSFEIDKKTLEDFRTLIYELEDLGVYMDFIWYEDSKFINDENCILHIIEDNKFKATWGDLSEQQEELYKSSIVKVDLEYTPDIYFIFVGLVFNKLTNIVFDFYEGPHGVYVSFFKSRQIQENIINPEDDTYIDEEVELMDSDL